MSNKNNSGEEFILSPNNSVVSNQLSEMKNYMASQVQENIMRSIKADLPKNIPMKNPNRRVEELLQDQIDQHNATEQKSDGEALRDYVREQKAQYQDR